MNARCTFPNCDCVGFCRRPRPTLDEALAQASSQADFMRPGGVLEAAENTPCPYCGRNMRRSHHWRAPTRDHVLPRAHGGSFLEEENRLIVCRRCNEDKASRTLIEFAGWLIASGDRRAERVKRLAVDLAQRSDVVLAAEEARALGKAREERP